MDTCFYKKKLFFTKKNKYISPTPNWKKKKHANLTSHFSVDLIKHKCTKLFIKKGENRH